MQQNKILPIEVKELIIKTFNNNKSITKTRDLLKINYTQITRVLDEFNLNYKCIKRIDSDGNRYCSKCLSYKPKDEFGKNIYYCKSCWLLVAKKHYKKDIVNIREKSRIKAAIFLEENRDKVNEYQKVNRYKYKNRINKYILQRRKDDELFRLGMNIRGLIKQSFKKKKHNKTSKTVDILGCSILEFKIYMESKWESWMNWDNYGKYFAKQNEGWDIDHIIPICLAKDKEELMTLNHYTNLQPLCSYINRVIKRNKIEFIKEYYGKSNTEKMIEQEIKLYEDKSPDELRQELIAKADKFMEKYIAGTDPITDGSKSMGVTKDKLI